jgi:hypothetical protein
MMIVTVIVPALKFQRLHETTHPHIPLFTNAGKVSRESPVGGAQIPACCSDLTNLSKEK